MMQDEGFARNIQNLFGANYGDDLKSLAGKTLARVLLNKERNEFAFVAADGTFAKFSVEGDCCSYSWVEHVTVTPGALGGKIMTVSDTRISQEENDEFDLLQIYEFRLGTDKGDVVVEFRNSSNGYYGGYVVPCYAGGIEDMKEVAE